MCTVHTRQTPRGKGQVSSLEEIVVAPGIMFFGCRDPFADNFASRTAKHLTEVRVQFVVSRVNVHPLLEVPFLAHLRKEMVS